MLVLIAKHVQWALAYADDYSMYSVSDWLINYEAGFVRRGLLGQLLFDAYQLWPFNVRVFILSLPLVFSPLLFALLFKVFYKEGWPPTVVFTVCCMGAFSFSPAVRRDYLVLIMAGLIFFLVSRWLSTKGRGRRTALFVAFTMLSFVLVLCYEPAVFIAFPLLFLAVKKEYGLRRTLLLAMPVVFVCAVVFLSRGGTAMAETIWQSWSPCFQRFPFPGGDGSVGLGVGALGWDMLPTFSFHLRMAYIGTDPLWLTALLIVYMLAGTYYLVVNLDVAMIPFWPKLPAHAATTPPFGHPYVFDARGMGNVLLLQFLAMLPMFTVLSCDWGRNICLCTVSTFFLLHFFPNATALLPYIDKVTTRLLPIFGRFRLFRSPLFYVFVALTVPMPLSEAPRLADSVVGIFLILLS